MDGLEGFPEAILAVFPDAQVQTCIVHLLRHSLDFVSPKDRKAAATTLKDIDRAVDAAAAAAALDAFEMGEWGNKYSDVVQSWRRAWVEVVPFHAFALEVRRLKELEQENGRPRRAVSDLISEKLILREAASETGELCA